MPKPEPDRFRDDDALGKVQVIVHTPPPAPRFLLLQRPAERDSIWQPVTGKIDASDPSPAVAARRELVEETGIGRVELLEDMDRVFRFRKGTRRVVEHLFRAEVPAPCSIVLSSEHVGSAWLDPEAAIDLLPWETNREGLREVLRRILPGESPHRSPSPR